MKAASYTAIVRPILEYSAPVWDPHRAKEKSELEMVQRRAARFAMNNYHEKTPGCVTSMMERLQWESLEDRRGKQRLNLLHKMNNKLVDVHINKYIKHNDSS